jgi:hypothetical protein
MLVSDLGVPYFLNDLLRVFSLPPLFYRCAGEDACPPPGDGGPSTPRVRHGDMPQHPHNRDASRRQSYVVSTSFDDTCWSTAYAPYRIVLGERCAPRSIERAGCRRCPV